MKKKKWKRRLLIFLGIVFILVTAAEITLRIVYSEQLKTRIYPLIYQPDSLLGFTYAPGVEGEIAQPGIHKKFRINSNGFYGPEFEKEKHGFRIAIVGASEASGIWLNGYENFSIKFQKMLEQRHINAEVLNCSMDGKMRDMNNVNLIRSQVINYHPDIVLLTADIPFIQGSYRRCNYRGYVLTYNGKSEASLRWCKAKIDYIEAHRLLRLLYSASYIVRAACRYYMYHKMNRKAYNLAVFVEKRIQAPDIQMLPLSIRQTINLLKDTEQKLRAVNATLVMYYYGPNEEYRKLLEQYGLRYLFLDIHDDKSLHYKLDGHYNEQGQTAIATQLMNNFQTLRSMAADTTTPAGIH